MLSINCLIWDNFDFWENIDQMNYFPSKNAKNKYHKLHPQQFHYIVIIFSDFEINCLFNWH